MSHLAYRKPRCQNLGAAIGLVVRAARECSAREQEIAQDLAAFHAPSECNEAAFRNVRAPMEAAMREAAALAGMPWWMVVQEAYARTRGRWMGWTFYCLEIPEFNAEA
jgi:hypothetical protein